jgi:hypothetical protein
VIWPDQQQILSGQAAASAAATGQARYAFPNGWGSGVLLGTPEHPAHFDCSPERPLEVGLLHADLTLCFGEVPTGCTWCSLDADAALALLDRIAARDPLPEGHACTAWSAADAGDGVD